MFSSLDSKVAAEKENKKTQSQNLALLHQVWIFVDKAPLGYRVRHERLDHDVGPAFLRRDQLLSPGWVPAVGDQMSALLPPHLLVLGLHIQTHTAKFFDPFVVALAIMNSGDQKVELDWLFF